MQIPGLIPALPMILLQTEACKHLTKAPNVYVMHSFVPYVSRMVLVIHHFWESWEDGHSNHFLFCGSDEGAAEKLQKPLPIYVHQLFLPPSSIIAPTWTHPNVHPQKPGQLQRLLCCETRHCAVRTTATGNGESHHQYCWLKPANRKDASQYDSTNSQKIGKTYCFRLHSRWQENDCHTSQASGCFRGKGRGGGREWEELQGRVLSWPGVFTLNTRMSLGIRFGYPSVCMSHNRKERKPGLIRPSKQS